MEKNYLDEILSERRSEEWIFGKDLEYQGLLSTDQVKKARIRDGIAVYEAIHKADKMIRVTVVLSDEKISGISISGDFFTQPYMGAISKLEKALIGVQLEVEDLSEKINKTFNQVGLKTFGAKPKDFVDAIMKIS